MDSGLVSEEDSSLDLILEIKSSSFSQSATVVVDRVSAAEYRADEIHGTL